ncbi:MAG: AraC family transcriptional regulator, partial [Porticoccaceae bacterium]
VEYVNLADERGMCSPLFAEQAMHKILHHLLINHNGFIVKEHKIQGGLSPQHFRFIRELIHQNLHLKLTIEMLSKEVNLSPYHFARMFKMSFGVSPANFITRSRVEVVKSLFGTSRSLAVISLDTGFSHQSHMTNSFRKLVGLTPAAYRRRVMKIGSKSA